jgi:hypothetical protein
MLKVFKRDLDLEEFGIDGGAKTLLGQVLILIRKYFINLPQLENKIKYCLKYKEDLGSLISYSFLIDEIKTIGKWEKYYIKNQKKNKRLKNELLLLISDLETFNTNPELIEDEKDYIECVIERLSKLKRSI